MMRPVFLLAVIGMMLPGCLGEDPSPEPPVDGHETTTPEVETVTLAFGQSPIGYDPRPLPVAANEPYHQSLPFVVPANATKVTASAEWSCVSLCRIEIRLHDSSEDVAGRTTAAGSANLEVESPAAGTWSFRWITDEVLSVNVQGTVTITIAFD